jgi:hypothetical protein
MASSIIIDLRPFVRRRGLHPDVSGMLKDQLSLGIASLDRSWILLHGCREEYCHRNICPGYYVLDNGDCLGSPVISTRLFGYFSLAYWCWYFYRW